MKIVIFGNIVHTNTFTGGDKIFTECAKQWIAQNHDVTIITNEAGVTFCTDRDILRRKILLWRSSFFDRYGVYVSLLVKAIVSFVHGLLFRPTHVDTIFASSFFIPDMLPAYLVKLRNPKATLVIACYLVSAQKWGADYSGGKLKGFLFYLNEQFAFWLLRHGQGRVITASEYDRHEFMKAQHYPAKQVLALRGGVDASFFQAIPKQKLLYDAVFVGRFHPQKSVGELIDIWGKVVARDATRKLALIGGGPLEYELKNLVVQKGLEKNITFLGVLDGIEKTNILKSSRMFISSSRHDSGNIALDEAMACGIPGIVYNLPRLWYPKGVLKIKIGNHKAFIKAIEYLCRYDKQRIQLGEDALAFAQTLDWKEKARELLSFMTRDIH
jgi:glycosyltransferase involved in cell wall biosynthesis